LAPEKVETNVGQGRGAAGGAVVVHTPKRDGEVPFGTVGVAQFARWCCKGLLFAVAPRDAPVLQCAIWVQRAIVRDNGDSVCFIQGVHAQRRNRRLVESLGVPSLGQGPAPETSGKKGAEKQQQAEDGQGAPRLIGLVYWQLGDSRSGFKR